MSSSSNTDILSGSAETAADKTPAAAESAAVPTEPVDSHTLWDRLGIVGSALCLAHCIATPLAIGFLSTAGLGFLGGEVVHKLLAFPLIIIAILAFWPGYRRHQNAAIVALGAAGAACLLVAVFVLEFFFPHSHGLETAVTIAGSILLIGAHTANWRITNKQCDDPHCAA